MGAEGVLGVDEKAGPEGTTVEDGVRRMDFSGAADAAGAGVDADEEGDKPCRDALNCEALAEAGFGTGKVSSA